MAAVSLAPSRGACVGRQVLIKPVSRLRPCGPYGVIAASARRVAIANTTRVREFSAGTDARAGAVGSKLTFNTIVEGKAMTRDRFEGKTVFVVNTASLCGLRPQLKELELVHRRFKDAGLVVLGVPSNDFGEQEPWEEDKIKEYYAKEFGVTFPLTAKTKVVGHDAHPLYTAVTDEFGPDAGPQWNFHKLLVGADGTLSGVFGSNMSPLEPEITEAIEEALPAKTEPA